MYNLEEPDTIQSEVGREIIHSYIVVLLMPHELILSRQIQESIQGKSWNMYYPVNFMDNIYYRWLNSVIPEYSTNQA